MSEILFFLKNPEVLLFTGLFVIVFVAMLLEFKLTSPRAWIILLAFTALGGLALWQSWRRKLLLKELDRREKALQELEDRYRRLKDEARISEAAYQKALDELAQARRNAALEVLAADAEYARREEEIRRKYQNLSPEETARKIRELLGRAPE